jgi:hypothetical protein
MVVVISAASRQLLRSLMNIAVRQFGVATIYEPKIRDRQRAVHTDRYLPNVEYITRACTCGNSAGDVGLVLKCAR